MITVFIIILTVGISFYAFGNPKVMNDYLFLVHRINNQKEYFRFVSSGFIHADFNHLLFNMITLFSFGSYVEAYFDAIFPSNSKVIFVLFYMSAMIVSQIPSYFKNKNNYQYASLGASGAISAVLYASILFDPWSKIYFFMIIPIPAVIFGALYLALSYYMHKNKIFNWEHLVHITGAIYGFIFPALFYPDLLLNFINQIIPN